jgi:hypothetical protein
MRPGGLSPASTTSMSSGRPAHAKPDFREFRLPAVSPTYHSLDSAPGADHVSAMKTVLSSV